MTTREDDIEIVKAMRKLLIALRRTGIVLAVLAVIAGVSAFADYPYASFVIGAALGIITGRGVRMAVNAGRLIAEIDVEIMTALVRRNAR